MPVVSIPVSLNMGGDASAVRRTSWIPTQGLGGASLDIALPATDAPIGTLSIEVCNHGVEGTPGAALPPEVLEGLIQPSTGTAWTCFIDRIRTTATFIAVVYTPSTGGAGASFTNGSGVGLPILFLKGFINTSILSATALDLRTVRIVFSSPSDLGAEAPSNWVFSGLSSPPFASPPVLTVTDASDADDGSVLDLYLYYDLTPGTTYQVTSVETDDAASFVAPSLPVITGRSFRLIDWIPEKNLREDDSGDLRKFVSVIDENIALLLNDVDQFGNIQDPDLAAEHFVDQMLSDLGNPFTEASLTLTKKRLLVKTLIPLFKSIGTADGILNAIWFFLGLEATITIVNRQGMRLGQSLLTVDWVLGCGPDKWRIILKVSTPEGRAFTSLETRVLNQIIKTMKYAHEHIDLQATLPAPTGVTATGLTTPDGIRVSWSAVAGAASYAVYMTSVTGTSIRNGSRWPASGTSLDFLMLPGEHRFFVVTAINAQGEGLSSDEVSVVST